MSRAGRWGALGVTVWAVLAGPRAAVAATEQPWVAVLLDDRAEVPPQDLARAKTEVQRVFHAIGVQIAWAERRLPVTVGGSRSAEGPSRQLSVTLANNLELPARGATGCALGLAAAALASAWVFYNRIVDTSRARPIDVTIVLGRVIAHEIGHLLLPPDSHSNYGIMRADLDLGLQNPDRFTVDQARAIRAGLASRPINGGS